MSGLVKKIAKKVKKVFKKIIKVVKKVLKSKLFKIAVIAVAVYFGGAALLAGSSLGGAAAAAPIIEAGASTAAINAGTAVAASSGASVLGATGAAATTATSTGGLLSSLTSGKALLASTALNMGGSFMQAKAADNQEKENKAELKRNNNTNLNIYGRTMTALDESGWRNPATGQIGGQANGQETAQEGNTTASRQRVSTLESNSAMAGVSSAVQESYSKAPKKAEPKFYDNASNKWQQVKTA